MAMLLTVSILQVENIPLQTCYYKLKVFFNLAISFYKLFTIMAMLVTVSILQFDNIPLQTFYYNDYACDCKYLKIDNFTLQTCYYNDSACDIKYSSI